MGPSNIQFPSVDLRASSSGSFVQFRVVAMDKRQGAKNQKAVRRSARLNKPQPLSTIEGERSPETIPRLFVFYGDKPNPSQNL